MERLKRVLTGVCDAYCMWPYDIRVKEQTCTVRDLSFAAVGAGKMNVKRSGREKSRTT
jgi:hypothetical protein